MKVLFRAGFLLILLVHREQVTEAVSLETNKETDTVKVNHFKLLYSIRLYSHNMNYSLLSSLCFPSVLSFKAYVAYCTLKLKQQNIQAHLTNNTLNMCPEIKLSKSLGISECSAVIYCVVVSSNEASWPKDTNSEVSNIDLEFVL